MQILGILLVCVAVCLLVYVRMYVLAILVGTAGIVGGFAGILARRPYTPQHKYYGGDDDGLTAWNKYVSDAATLQALSELKRTSVASANNGANTNKNIAELNTSIANDWKSNIIVNDNKHGIEKEYFNPQSNPINENTTKTPMYWDIIAKYTPISLIDNKTSADNTIETLISNKLKPLNAAPKPPPNASNKQKEAPKMSLETFHAYTGTEYALRETYKLYGSVLKTFLDIAKEDHKARAAMKVPWITKRSQDRIDILRAKYNQYTACNCCWICEDICDCIGSIFKCILSGSRGAYHASSFQQH